MGTLMLNGINYTGGGGGMAYGGSAKPLSTLGNNGDYYYQYGVNNPDIEKEYVKINNIWRLLPSSGGGEKYEIDNYHSRSPLEIVLPAETLTQGRIETQYSPQIMIANLESANVMNVSITDKIVQQYISGLNIGCSIYSAIPVDPKYNSITFSAVVTGACYSTAPTRQDWAPAVGVRATAGQRPTSNDANWLAKQVFDITGYDPTQEYAFSGTIDISSLTGKYYLYLNGHGWTVYWNSIQFNI